MTMAPLRLHATAVALPLPGGDYGAVILRGPAGAGKSDLALRLIESGAVLVADDQVLLRRDDGGIRVRPPAALEGLMELRGQGIRKFPHLSDVPLLLVVDLVDPTSLERMPDPARVTILEESLPHLNAAAFEASAAAKVRQAYLAVAAGSGQAAEVVDELHGEADSSSEKVNKSRLVLVTGMSGAGRATALHILEDFGYEAIDNLPMDLLEQLVVGNTELRNLAIGIDCRTHRFSAETFLNVLGRLRSMEPARLETSLLFLDGSDDALERRFTATRRRHPLTLDRPLTDGILAERSLLAPLQTAADLVVDTTDLRPVDLQHLLKSRFAMTTTPGMAIFLQSFSYRRGLPRQADLVFDLRFLRNPFYEPTLRSRDGRDSQVAAFIRNDPAYETFFTGLTELLKPLLARYEDEGKTYLTIALGCTGGQHRSVFVAQELTDWAREAGYEVSLNHRELT